MTRFANTSYNVDDGQMNASCHNGNALKRRASEIAFSLSLSLCKWLTNMATLEQQWTPSAAFVLCFCANLHGIAIESCGE